MSKKKTPAIVDITELARQHTPKQLTTGQRIKIKLTRIATIILRAAINLMK